MSTASSRMIPPHWLRQAATDSGITVPHRRPRVDMQPIEPNRSLNAHLTAEQWNTVMAALNELPHRLARPIFDSLMTQLQQQSQPQMQMSEE